MIKLNILTAAVLGAVSYTASAEIPAGYYDSCDGLTTSQLLSKLGSVVGKHTDVGYKGLWTLYETSDVTADGRIWDMYSTKRWSIGERCGTYHELGDCYNREHSFPKSWFNDASPMVSDAFHIYPTDGKVNGQRSNHPFGECAGGTSLGTRNGVQALGRLGQSTYPGYSDIVFEPDDQYKGDFARSYFYMAAAYNDRISSWSSAMLNGSAYPAFSGWAKEMLLKWHRADPVSQKELERNEAVYARQKNRNPFIDHPELAEYIWGDKAGERWSTNPNREPSIVLPAAGSTVAFGNVSVGYGATKTVTVKTDNAKEAVTVTVSGDAFAIVGTGTIAASQANSVEGATVTLKCTAAAVGAVTGAMTVTSGSLSRTVALTATAFDGLPASAPTAISDCSFVAHWTYIGNEDANGCYRIHVLDASGSDVDTYPRSVRAVDGQALVDELEPETAYSYYISCLDGAMKSNTISVTTGAPVPMVTFMYGGQLELTAEPGVPGDAVEIMMDCENITGTVTVAVQSPFQLSSDKAEWGTQLTLSPVEDRFYLRLNSTTAGVFESALTATATEPAFFSDDATVHGTCAAASSFFEGFENEANGNYDASSVKGDACEWAMTDGGVYAVKAEAYEGSNYFRFGKSASSVLAMNEDRTAGIGTVKLQAAPWSKSDGDIEYAVEYSTDGGQTWQTAGTQKLTAAGNEKKYAPYTYTVNRAGNVRLRIRQTAGKRFLMDNIEMTGYTSSVGEIDGISSNPDLWDAFCRNSQLVVSLTEAANVRVYGVDGQQYLSAGLQAGETVVALPKGLYIVAVADFTRRVLVK